MDVTPDIEAEVLVPDVAEDLGFTEDVTAPPEGLPDRCTVQVRVTLDGEAAPGATPIQGGLPDLVLTDEAGEATFEIDALIDPEFAGN